MTHRAATAVPIAERPARRPISIPLYDPSVPHGGTFPNRAPKRERGGLVRLDTDTGPNPVVGDPRRRVRPAVPATSRRRTSNCLRHWCGGPCGEHSAETPRRSTGTGGYPPSGRSRMGGGCRIGRASRPDARQRASRSVPRGSGRSGRGTWGPERIALCRVIRPRISEWPRNRSTRGTPRRPLRTSGRHVPAPRRYSSGYLHCVIPRVCHRSIRGRRSRQPISRNAYPYPLTSSRKRVRPDYRLDRAAANETCMFRPVDPRIPFDRSEGPNRP